MSNPTARYYRSLTEANEKFGWPEIPDGCPMEFFAQMMAVRQQEHPEAAVHRIEYRMKWYKHLSDFRRSPKMLHVQQILGDYGVAGVYRLYEVFAQRFGVDDDFTGTICLSPPYSEKWLAQEILTYDWDDRDSNTDDDGKFQSPEAKLLYFLGVCEQAGLVELSKEECDIAQLQNDGTHKVTGKKVWTTITIPGFAALKDDWTGTKKTKSKALSTPE